jgi:hypothetical protein
MLHEQQAEKGGAFGAMAILMLNGLVPRHACNQRQWRCEQRMSSIIRGKTVLIYGLTKCSS